jgi:transposase
MKNIISIDESSFYLNMTRNYSKSKKEKRAYKKTYIYPFNRYNFICAIKYGKIIGFKLYEHLKGGIKLDEFLKFIKKCVKDKYTNHYILMDNAITHKAKIVKEGILETKNKYIYALPYQPDTNPVEGLFSQIKNYVRQDNPQTIEELKESINYTIINHITKEHLKNYFKIFFLQVQSFVDKNS